MVRTRLHLPTAIKLAKDHDLEFYVLLLEAEGDVRTAEAIAYLHDIDKNIKIVVLKDAVYGEKRGRKNKKFVTEITPKNFTTIDDYSKYIVLDKKGEVTMVTSWKDNKDNDWRDDSEMVQKRVVPVLR